MLLTHLVLSRRTTDIKIIYKPITHEKYPNTGKYGPEKTPYLDTFHVVSETRCKLNSRKKQLKNI